MTYLDALAFVRTATASAPMITSDAEATAYAARANLAAEVLYGHGLRSDWKEADALFYAQPWLSNYDSKGNWTGTVANENGWTA